METAEVFMEKFAYEGDTPKSQTLLSLDLSQQLTRKMRRKVCFVLFLSREVI